RRVGARIGNRFRGLRDRYRRWQERRRQRAAQRRADREQRRRARRERAERETVRAINRMLSGQGISDLAFRARLAWLKARWRWSTLRVDNQGETRRVLGALSPLRPLPTPTIEHNLKVLGELIINLKGGGTARIAAGEEQVVDPRVQARVGTAR